MNINRILSPLSLLAACLAAQHGVAGTPVDLGIAEITADGALVRPDVTEWVHMGSSIGLGYAAGEFDADRPGTIQVVHMEPSAYAWFREHGEYADGSMLSLSFYAVQEKAQPALNGFAQQDLVSFEIHVLDKNRYADDRGFYLFNNGDTTAAMVPPGNECVTCHNREAAFDGTFTQFYPPVRDIPTRRGGL